VNSSPYSAQGPIFGRNRSSYQALPFARSLAMTGTGEAELAAPLCQGYHQEAEILLGWLEGEGVRTVLCEGSWQVPARARFDAEHLARRFAMTSTAQGE